MRCRVYGSRFAGERAAASVRASLVDAPRGPWRHPGAALTVRPRVAGDTVLVRRIQRGSSEAAAELFARHWPTARKAALAITASEASADDVAQDAFERAFARIDQFDRQRPFAPWLHRIVVNRAIDHLRAERRLVSLGDASLEDLSSSDAPDALDGPVLGALARLSPERRAVVVLRHLLGYTPGEIARMLELPRGTVNSRLRRGLDCLARELGEER